MQTLKKKLGTLYLVIFLSLLVSLPVFAEKKGPFGSDKKNKTGRETTTFKKSTYPKFKEWMTGGLDVQTLFDRSVIALDPSKISLTTQSNVKAINLSRRFKNRSTLGINVTQSTIPEQEGELLFPKNLNKKNNKWKKRGSYPIKPNDFMKFGPVEAGAQLDFFLISNNASRPGFGKKNKGQSIADGLQHAVVYAVKNSPYLLVGFDDLYGQNYRSQDLYFAVDIGKENVAQLATVPEPSTYAMMIIFLLITVYSVKHRKTLESLPENTTLS